jgi:heterodisulfide reductase subunit C2
MPTERELDPAFRNEVAATPGGENISLCFACGTCTASCPVSGIDAEFDPRKLIRQILLGMRKEVLGSPVIWRCVQCYSCTAKCPQNVRFREIIRALREMAVAEGHADAALAARVEEIGQLAQKLRRDMVAAVVAEPGRFEELKQRAAAVVE